MQIAAGRIQAPAAAKDSYMERMLLLGELEVAPKSRESCWSWDVLRLSQSFSRLDIPTKLNMFDIMVTFILFIHPHVRQNRKSANFALSYELTLAVAS